MFKYFKLLILQGFIAARKHSDKILSLIDIMRAGKYTFNICWALILNIYMFPSSLVLTSKFSFEGSQLPCFTSGSASSAQMMKSRFHMNLTEEQLLDLVNNLVDQAINSLTTKLYDGFQYYSNGILWIILSDFSHKIYSRSYVMLHYQLKKQCINHEYSKYYSTQSRHFYIPV